MRDLPHSFCLSQNQGAAIDKPRAVVQLKRHDSRIANDFDSQVARLEVHVRPRSSSRTDLFKDQAKVCFILGATVGSVRDASRIKDCGIVGERIAELVPLQMVERRNECGEKCSNGGCSAWLVGVCARKPWTSSKSAATSAAPNGTHFCFMIT